MPGFVVSFGLSEKIRIIFFQNLGIYLALEVVVVVVVGACPTITLGRGHDVLKFITIN